MAQDDAGQDALISTRHAAVEELRWRDEILGVLYWLRGEGIMGAATVGDLSGFLVADAGVLGDQLERLVAGGYLERADADDEVRYSLSEVGGREGGRVFADDFAELTGAAHGECGPGCLNCQQHGIGACKNLVA